MVFLLESFSGENMNINSLYYCIQVSQNDHFTLANIIMLWRKASEGVNSSRNTGFHVIDRLVQASPPPLLYLCFVTSTGSSPMQEVLKYLLWLWKGNIWILFSYLKFVLILNQYVVLVISVQTTPRLSCWQCSYIPEECCLKAKMLQKSQCISVTLCFIWHQ